ncbi:hypothetical protein [Streptomyces sp. NBC_00728]|uniref:hypothetical protein n=1 Tax=Streptomyces sp. NBC_00728 TaxID=2903676 RepID=UPI00386B2C6E
MLIDGYEDAPLVAGEELLSLPGFWAAYLMWLCETEEDEPDPAWFGVDGADADAAYEALAEAERWPVFRIPFGEGHTSGTRRHRFCRLQTALGADQQSLLDLNNKETSARSPAQ